MALQTLPLCDYCHQKPQFAGHNFCSKTCAAQASTNATTVNNTTCSQCHKKPKFQNFEFCGKTCASQALAQRQASGPKRSKVPNVPAAQSAQAQANPMQVAQFIAQQVPQVKALLAAVNGVPAAGIVAPQVNPGVVAASSMGIMPQNNPFLQQPAVVPGVVVPANGTAAVYSNPPPAAQQLPASQPPVPPPECLIPGCGKPVHTDANGMTTSDYCSKRHREEAVSSGYADPCIMCLKFPQGDKDYFCSRMCRDEAMAKLPQ